MPSFYNYYEEALGALNELNTEDNFKSVFESKNDYSIYEWKAIKCLARESIKDLQPDKKDTSTGKHKDYRLLNIIKKREDEFGENASKRQKI